MPRGAFKIFSNFVHIIRNAILLLCQLLRLLFRDFKILFKAHVLGHLGKFFADFLQFVLGLLRSLFSKFRCWIFCVQLGRFLFLQLSSSLFGFLALLLSEFSCFTCRLLKTLGVCLTLF